MIIASIRALGNSAPATATDWLTRLSALPNETFSLGYGDADIVGQVQAGLAGPLAPLGLSYALNPENFSPRPGSLGERSNTVTTEDTPPAPTPGSEPVSPTLDELLDWNYTLGGIGWAGDKTVRSANVAPLAAVGLKTLIVSGDNTNQNQLDSTPNSTFHRDGATLTASDQRLSAALREAASAPSDFAWNTAMSRVYAQLQLLSAETDSARHMLIALDRSWPSSGSQLQRTLNALFGTPWATAAPFSTLAAATPSRDLTLIDAPESSTRINTIRVLLDAEKALTDFSSVLADPTKLTERARAHVLTLLAVSWQNPRTDWASAVAKNRDATTKIVDSIRILPPENVNLVSAQGSIPFTVSNELPDDVATVTLNASPSNGRLEIDKPTTKAIPPGSRATMLVPVKAKVGNGQVVLGLQLHSPTGVPIGDPSAVTVKVHADWEGIGALILVIFLLLLFGFGVVRGFLRRRGQTRAESSEARDTGESKMTSANTDDGLLPTDRAVPESTPPSG
jgi:hypothetical protein